MAIHVKKSIGHLWYFPILFLYPPMQPTHSSQRCRPHFVDAREASPTPSSPTPHLRIFIFPTSCKPSGRGRLAPMAPTCSSHVAAASARGGNQRLPRLPRASNSILVDSTSGGQRRPWFSWPSLLHGWSPACDNIYPAAVPSTIPFIVCSGFFATDLTCDFFLSANLSYLGYTDDQTEFLVDRTLGYRFFK